MKKLTSTLPNMVLSLVGICVLVSALLAYLNSITKEPIKEAQIKAKIEAIKLVAPPFENNPYTESYILEVEGEKVTVYPAKSKGETVGYALEVNTKNGFNGLMEFMLGIDAKGVLIDYSVLTIAETPGLGSKIPEWFRSSANSTKGHIQDLRHLNLNEEAPLKVKQDGGKVDGITAATISSRAFLEAINKGYSTYKTIQTKDRK